MHAGIHDEWLKSPLERALENLHKDSIMVALYLIKHGCGAEKDIAYLLCIASHRGEINMVKELIEKYKANPNSELIMANVSFSLLFTFRINVKSTLLFTFRIKLVMT